jgi:hypothetical protein
MQNLEKSAKSKGVVIFAFNSATVDYIALADQTSRLVEHNLNLPITLITDLDAEPKFKYDKIVRVSSQGGNVRKADGDQMIEWRNFGRYLAYQLSPYDSTVLIDGDYLVLDKSLLTLLEQDFDYRLMHHNQTPDGPAHEIMGYQSLNFVWATVVLFRKTAKAKKLFDLVGRVQRNYGYYKTLYNGSGTYRNDYAFAIANMILNGYSSAEHKSIPWSMTTIEHKIKRIDIKNNLLVVRHQNNAVVTPRQNLHIMDKDFLTSEEFREFVDYAVQ